MDKIHKINATQVASVSNKTKANKTENAPRPNQSGSTQENSLTEFHPIPEDVRAKKNIFQKIIDFFKGLFGTKDTDNDSRYDVNGQLDMDAHQGRYANCALIGACYSLQYSDFGKDILKDAIKINKNENGKIESYSVYFKGADATYTITKKELEKADSLYNKEGSRHYSVGDDDMLLLELAYSKLATDPAHKDLEQNVPQKGFSLGSTELDGINHHLVMYALTGKPYDTIDKNKFLQIKTREILNQLENSETFSFARTTPDELNLLDINGKNITLNSGEIYEITEYNGGFVRYNNYSDMSNTSSKKPMTLKDANGIEYTFYSSELAKGLTSNPRCLQDDDYNVYLDKKLDSIKNGAATMLAVRNKIDTQDVNGENITIVGQHAYIVKALDDETITILNTYDTGKDIVLNIDNFRAISKEIDIETLELD